MRLFKQLFWKILWWGKGAFCKDEVRTAGRVGGEDTLKLICQDIAVKLRLNSSDIVLDVGCAGGMLDLGLRDRVDKITAIDNSPSMIARAAKNVAGRNNIELICCDPSSIPKPDKYFSKIFVYSVFQYLQSEQEIVKTLLELRRLLKDDGLILIGEILDPQLWGRRGQYEKESLLTRLKHRANKALAFWYEKDHLISICNKAGFDAKAVSQPENLPHFNTSYDLLLSKKPAVNPPLREEDAGAP